MYICFYPDCSVVLKSILLYFDNCDDTIKIKNIEDDDFLGTVGRGRYGEIKIKFNM